MKARVVPALAAVLAVMAGCGHHRGGPAVGGPPTPASTASTAASEAAPAPPRAAGYGYADPSDVCRRFAGALYSADTTRDLGPGDAYTRAGAYMTGDLYAQAGGADADGRWETWVAHRAALRLQISGWSDDEQPPDSSVSAYRAERLTVTPVGRDGWTGWADTFLLYCTLARQDDGWRVAGYDVGAAGPR